MNKEFIYEFKKDILTIKQCPHNILTYNLMFAISQNKIIKNIILLDGIEKIDVGTFQHLKNLKKISLPNTLKIIESSSFEYCEQLKEIEMPDSVNYIGSYAFNECVNLRKVNIPGNVKIIEHDAFCNCKKLKKINIEEGVEKIERDVFSNCKKLRKIKLPLSIRHIGEGSFKECSNLREIAIPEGVKVLDSCFIECKNLKKVTLPNTLKTITNSAFKKCYKLGEIKLPDNLKIIGQNAFCQTGLWSINIPDTVNSVEEGAFKNCFNLRKVSLSKNLIVIGRDVFSYCYNLKKVIIPEGIKKIELSAFNECYSLEEIHFPSTIECVNVGDSFMYSLHFDKIFIQCKDGEKEIDVTTKRFIGNNEGNLFLFDKKIQQYSFYNEGEYVEFDKLDLDKNIKVKQMIRWEQMNEKHFIKLYYWLNKKIIPGPAVIRTMPIKDIDKFFMNKNCNEWSKLVKETGITYIQNLISFFKLCYVLGVFSESTSTRDKAVEFIRENIINKLNGQMIHSRFDGFELSNGFNEEYAEFFIKYYNDEDFMKDTDRDVRGEEEDVDLIAASYNNFKQVKKVYPNRTIHTNRRADLLLPEHVINAIKLVQYHNVDDGNEEFAKVIGRYGYSQEQFEKLQNWYNIGKSLTKINLFLSDDKETKGIRYELLSKHDPLNAVLGNITNCCQVVDGQGETCLKYGMTMPNSGFITFNYKEKIIGQGWVWYDEINKTVCLDNVEVPHRYIEKINENKQIQDSFIRCLLRIEENIKKEMTNKGLEVTKVTIGKGYNDIGSILDKKFETDNDANRLCNYNGYSDATKQYQIKKKR